MYKTYLVQNISLKYVFFIKHSEYFHNVTDSIIYQIEALFKTVTQKINTGHGWL